jgi:FkbM family methyltransferase
MNFIPKLKRFLRRNLEKFNFIEIQTVCFSQEGEDLILEEYFQGVNKGFYIDIGAYHPIRYSNTYKFYLKGWHGINIDARPGSMQIFKKVRPKDINLEIAIGNRSECLKYYMFDEPALNGFSKEISEERDRDFHFNILKTVDINLERLEVILDNFLPENTEIHFLSIDVEGLDYEVLLSNNFNKYRPKMILVETSVISEGLAFDSEINLFLNENGYSLVAKTFRTSFYKLNLC